MGTDRSNPSTSSWVSVMNCDVLGLSGSMTCGCTPATPSTLRIASMLADGKSPPAVKPAPIPIPRPATEICPSTKRSPPSMKATMRSAIAPSATMPATPMAMPAMVNAYPRRARRRPRTLPLEARLDGQTATPPYPPLDTGHAEEEAQRQPRAPRHADPVPARQHVQHGRVDAERVARMHEDVEEGRLVVLVDELEERREAATNPPRVVGEPRAAEVAGREGVHDGGGRQLTGAHGDVDAAREDRVDEGDGVADGDEAVADHRRVLVREVRVAVHGRHPLGAGEVGRHAGRAGQHGRVQAVHVARPRP